MNEAKELTARLNGEWFERRGYGAARCPAHDDHDPSLLIGTFPNGKLRLKCLTGCDGHAVFAAIKALNLPYSNRQHVAILPEQPQKPATDDDYRRIALKTWRGARERIEDTPVAAYLAARGCPPPPAGSAVMRFDPACWHKPTKQRLPAMICRVTDFQNAEKTLSIHRTFLRPDGSGKADVPKPKMCLGPIGGSVIRLVDDADIDVRLNLAEGIETALTCIKNGWQTWSAVNAGNMGSLPVLPGLDLGIFADHDESGTGEREANKLAQRWAAAGQWADIFTPDIIGDWNDVEARA